MRLLFVIDSLNSGGAQRQIVTLATALRQRGHDATFFCYVAGDLLGAPLKEAGIPVVLQPKTRRFSIAAPLALRRLIRDGDYDAVISFLRTPNVYAVLAARTLRRGVRVVVSERFYDPPEGVDWLTELGRVLYRFSDAVVLNSHHQRQHFEATYPAIRRRLSTIYNGLDLARFCPPQCEPPPAPLRLVAVGSVSPHKNGMCVARALAIARKKFKLDVTLTWIGAHHAAHESYSAAMRREIHTLGLDHCWTWVAPTDRVAEIIPTHRSARVSRTSSVRRCRAAELSS